MEVFFWSNKHPTQLATVTSITASKQMNQSIITHEGPQLIDNITIKILSRHTSQKVVAEKPTFDYKQHLLWLRMGCD